MPASGESPLPTPVGGPGVGPRRTRGAEQQVPLLRAPHNEGLTLPPPPLPTTPDGLPEAEPCSLHSSTQKLWCFPAAWGREGASTGIRPAQRACVNTDHWTKPPKGSTHPSTLPTQSRLSPLTAHPCTWGTSTCCKGPHRKYFKLCRPHPHSLCCIVFIFVFVFAFFFLLQTKTGWTVSLPSSVLTKQGQL